MSHWSLRCASFIHATIVPWGVHFPNLQMGLCDVNGPCSHLVIWTMPKGIHGVSWHKCKRFREWPRYWMHDVGNCSPTHEVRCFRRDNKRTWQILPHQDPHLENVLPCVGHVKHEDILAVFHIRLEHLSKVTASWSMHFTCKQGTKLENSFQVKIFYWAMSSHKWALWNWRAPWSFRMSACKLVHDFHVNILIFLTN